MRLKYTTDTGDVMKTATAQTTQPRSLPAREDRAVEGRDSSRWHPLAVTLVATCIGLALIAVGLAVAG